MSPVKCGAYFCRDKNGWSSVTFEHLWLILKGSKFRVNFKTIIQIQKNHKTNPRSRFSHRFIRNHGSNVASMSPESKKDKIFRSISNHQYISASKNKKNYKIELIQFFLNDGQNHFPVLMFEISYWNFHLRFFKNSV